MLDIWRCTFFMARVKYSLEDKIKVVKDVLELGMSYHAIARSLHTSKAMIKRWVERYEKFGVDGLTMKSGSYTGEFKVHVVEYIHEHGMSLCEGAVHFGIPNDTTIGIWRRIYLEEGQEALYKDNRGRKCKAMKDEIEKTTIDKQEEEDLIAEVKRLRMENEYLKKLNALVQAKEKSARKIK